MLITIDSDRFWAALHLSADASNEVSRAIAEALISVEPQHLHLDNVKTHNFPPST